MQVRILYIWLMDYKGNFMGRSKEKGKAVSELSPQELQKEKIRCEEMIRYTTNKDVAKYLSKRLREIERVLDDE